MLILSGDSVLVYHDTRSLHCHDGTFLCGTCAFGRPDEGNLSWFKSLYPGPYTFRHFPQAALPYPFRLEPT